MSRQVIIPLFPLEIVLFPDLPLPLHIFEERYKTMIADCLQNGLDFGIVYQHDDILSPVGCTAKIVKVQKKYKDGRMDILVQGTDRFKIEEILRDKSYLRSRVSYIEDQDARDEADIQKLARTGIMLLENLEQIALRRQDTKFMEGLNYQIVSFILAGVSGFSLDRKQQILEMTSTAERLRLGIEQLQLVIAYARIKDQQKTPAPDAKTFKGFSLN
jgi:Lon protease-like protein